MAFLIFGSCPIEISGFQPINYHFSIVIAMLWCIWQHLTHLTHFKARSIVFAKTKTLITHQIHAREQTSQSINHSSLSTKYQILFFSLLFLFFCFWCFFEFYWILYSLCKSGIQPFILDLSLLFFLFLLFWCVSLFFVIFHCNFPLCVFWCDITTHDKD